MKKIGIIVAIAFAIIIAFFIGRSMFFFTPSSDSATEAQLKKVKADLKKTKDELKKAKDDKNKAEEGKKDAEDELKKVKAELKKVNSESMYKEAFNTIFYDMEERFVINNPDFRFYSSPYCTPDTLIEKELTFVNHRDEEGKNDAGLKVFVSRSTEGPAYSSEQPFFNTIETKN